MKYYVEIVETLSRIEEIDAIDENDALDTIQIAYNNEEIVLDAEDYVNTEFYLREDTTDE